MLCEIGLSPGAGERVVLWWWLQVMVNWRRTSGHHLLTRNGVNLLLLWLPSLHNGREGGGLGNEGQVEQL